jgi:ADP-heptose:LPS heptosyltransferase
MNCSPLPPPEAVNSVLIWHQGALGDLLLAGPALMAVRERYPRAGLIGLGHPERWRLFSRTLSLAGAWDSGEAAWAALFNDGPLPPELRARLAPFQLALVFSLRPETPMPGRLRQAGIPAVYWVPSFPAAGPESVAAVQSRRLAELGLTNAPNSFQLTPPAIREEDQAFLSGPSAWLAVAPGSGHAAKNWPLSHYYEVSRALAWEHQLRVVWLAGPAEIAWLPYLQALAAAQGHLLVAGANLSRVAALLARCRLFLGNDSGLTHLAAALNVPAVLALFGPTDPRVWAPPGGRVRVLTGPCLQAPCARGREIPCPEPRCLQDLSPSLVRQAAAAILPPSS